MRENCFGAAHKTISLRPRLFNASLDGGTRRAIDIREGAEPDASAFQALVREAAALNPPDTEP